ncbi:MAG: hypothetical protein IPL51_03705 [Candidatus Competibacteraceae bacterium]|nr:hypothetical protein [Candidatus Competibacteraceae bacterium]
MTRRDRDHHRLRTLLAQECARLMTEEGIKDFRTAKRKAALRLAVSDRAVLPDNTEIEQAVIEHQRLFHAQQQPAHLRQLRRQALDAMRFLAPFRPKLVGSVLNGTAGLHADIQLHLFADTPSEVLLFLMEHRIPLETAERRLTLNNGNQISLPVFRFKAGDAPLDLTVFATLSEREPPRSPVDGRPLRRASLGEVEALLASDLPQGLF